MKCATKLGNSLRLDWWESCQDLPEEGWMSGRGRLLPSLLRLLHASLHWADGGLFLEAFSGTCQNTPLPFEKSHLNWRQRGLACCRMGSTLLISAPGWSRGTPGEVGRGEWKGSVHLTLCSTPTDCAVCILTLDQRGEKHEAVYRILSQT